MNQMTTYVLIMSGLTLLFYLMGLTDTNPLLNLLLSPQSLSTTTWWVAISVAVFGASGLLLGAVYKNAEIATMSIVVPLVVTVLWGFTEVIITVSKYNTILSLLIFGPLMLLFVLTTVEYWRGRD